jgi:anti-sigma regulatory factor (Ser/Thr protein kinase)
MMSTPGSDVATIADLSSVDPPLGVDTGVRRRAITVDLPPGAVLALFTDGLVERRDEVITEGMERLRAALATGSAERRCASAIQTMLGGGEPHDDVALLVIEREDGGLPPLEITVPAVATALVLVRTAMRRWLSKLGVEGDEEYNIMLGVGEAMANVVSHAYGPSGGKLDVAVSSTPDDIVATIRDTGRWRLPRGKNRGRGLTIMEKCADEVTVDTTESGTEVRLRFRLRGAPR